MKREVILYIAMSLDGSIAGENDDLSFLEAAEYPGEDYGYEDFCKKVDTVIWGRKTYDKVRSFGTDFPHKDKKVYVLSNSRTGSDENVEYFSGDIRELIAALRESEGKHIYIDGGAELVYELMKHDLIDRYIISIIPALVGGGIRLFKGGTPAAKLKMVKSSVFPSGVVQVHYLKSPG